MVQSRRLQPSCWQLPAAMLRSLPTVALAPSPGSLQLSWLGSPQRTSVFPHVGSPSSRREVSHQPAPHPTKTYLLTAGPQAPMLPRHRWPVTLSSSRCNVRCSILIADDQHDQPAALSLTARLSEGDLQTNHCRDD